MSLSDLTEVATNVILICLGSGQDTRIFMQHNLEKNRYQFDFAYKRSI